jgi:hypothetical protein
VDQAAEDRQEPDDEQIAVPVRVLRELEEALSEIRALLDDPAALRGRLRKLARVAD